MVSTKSIFAALPVLAHYLSTVSAAPTPIGFDDIIDSLGDIVDGISELSDSDLVDSLLGNDESAVASTAVSPAVTSSKSCSK